MGENFSSGSKTSKQTNKTNKHISIYELCFNQNFWGHSAASSDTETKSNIHVDQNDMNYDMEMAMTIKAF